MAPRYETAAQGHASGTTGPTTVRRLLATASMLCLLLGGCHHRQMLPTLPAVLHPPATPPPAPDAPTMPGPPPESISTAPPVKVTEAKPKPRVRKTPKTVPPVVTPPVETAAAAPPPASTIGELSAGGESNPNNQKEANDLIVASERRLDALSKTKAGQQASQIREIRRFLQQAREALVTGDTEGAKTLATKAKLLLDDIEKWEQP